MTPGEDFVVIGAGIVGLATALHLADLGASVTVVEKDAPDSGTSAHSFATLSAFDCGDRNHYLLCSSGLSEWRRWGRRLGGYDGIGLHFNGAVRWTRPGASHELPGHVEELQARGYPVRTVGPEKIRSLLPGAVVGDVQTAAFCEADGHVDPGAALTAARLASMEAGVRIVFGQVARVSIGDSGVTVAFGTENATPHSVVVAAGADAQELARHSGLSFPLRGVPALMVTTEPIEPLLTLPTYVLEPDAGWLAVAQRDDGRVVLTRPDASAQGLEPTEDNGRRIKRAGAHIFPRLEGAGIESLALRWRALCGDGLPVVGRLPEMQDIYSLIADPGITLAPVLGKLVAEELTGAGPARLLEPFSPARFARRAAETAEAVDAIFDGGSS